MNLVACNTINNRPEVRQTRGGRVAQKIKLGFRDVELMEFAARGYTDNEISQALCLSRETVTTYWRRLLRKYGASSRTQAVAEYSKHLASLKVAELERQNAELLMELQALRSQAMSTSRAA